ncbi:MAG: carbohydrate-binding family 9-like protein, partial [Armatimonadota bacterium]|nr:carbohydrate-binding family 9-like protein [Armatimonadota bacterium]
MKNIAVFFLLSCMLVVSIQAHSALESKVVVVPRAESEIRIDGHLSEAAWTKAGRITSFEDYRKQKGVKNQTEVRLLYDNDAFYVAFICIESDMKTLKAAVTEHDGSLWNDDCVEIFLDVKGDRLSYVHFILNTLGVQYDALGDDPHIWNPHWEAKVCLFDKQWKAEVKIPFKELGLRSFPEPGEFWFGNFCREKQQEEELSCWSPTMGGFDAPGYFGKIVFSSHGDDYNFLVKQAKGQRPNRISEYLVWETTPWRHFSAKENTSAIKSDTTSVDVFVLAGQIESRALMISNLTDETLSARLIVEGFDGVEVETLIPTFVRTADCRPFPDALVPPDPIGQIIIPAGETRQVWLNIKGVKDGRFEGNIIISPLTASK